MNDPTNRLANTLSDLGHECCEKGTLVDIFTQLSPTLSNREGQLVRAIVMMTKAKAGWDPKIFAQAFHEVVNNIQPYIAYL